MRILLLLLVCVGCVPSTSWDVPWPGSDRACEVTLCLPGAGGLEAGDNPTLDLWCRELPGIVRRCDAEPCRALMRNVGEAREALDFVADRIAANVTAATQATCTVRLVGYSWGGVDAVEFAGEVAARTRVPNDVSLVVVLDGYSPFAGEYIEVPDGLGEVASFRHSISTPDDCSSGDPLGPYRGLPIRCGKDASCHDFDLSKDGEAHDHCDMVEAPGDLWFYLLFGFPIETVNRSFEVPVARRE